jgi:hypothetical protein
LSSRYKPLKPISTKNVKWYMKYKTNLVTCY